MSASTTLRGRVDPSHRERLVPEVQGDLGVSVTDDRNDPRLGHGVDEKPTEMNEAYLVLSEDERKKGWVRPFRNKYVHTRGCGGVTIMGDALSETYAKNPKFYGATYCVGCKMHRPVAEFDWDVDGQPVGS